ncbi:unnamed protein product [Symbiodinium sp. KB8]|nr:unnamed protein product [Symbiodinium sp. KB8]
MEAALEDMRSFLQKADLSYSEMEQPLPDVLEHVFSQLASQGRCGCIIVCNSKSSVLLSCGHGSCPRVHFDPHTATLEHMTSSVSVICGSAAELLACMTGPGLYEAHMTATAYFLKLGQHTSPAGSCTCIWPDHAGMQDPRTLCPPPAALSQTRERADPVQPGAKTEKEPALDFGALVSSTFGKSTTIDLESDSDAAGTPRPRPKRPRTFSPEKHKKPAEKSSVLLKQEVPVKKESSAVGDMVPVKQESSAIGDVVPVKQEISADVLVLEDTTEAGTSSGAASKSKKPKRTLVEIRAERDLKERGKQAVRKMQIDFQQDFQPAHSYKLDPGHWLAFQKALALGRLDDLGCAHCLNLVTSKGAPIPLDSASEAIVAVEDQPLLRRERAGQKEFEARLQRLKEQDLYRWLAVRRPNLYEADPDKPTVLCCKICGSSVNTRRTSTIHYVLQHESYDFHVAAEAARHSGRECTGLALVEGSGVQAAAYASSFWSWAANRFPWSGNEVAHACRIEARETVPVIRAQSCIDSAARFVPSQKARACSACTDLANRMSFIQKVCRWSYCIDLCHLLQVSAENKKRIMQHDTMADADYVPLLGLGTELETLRSMSHPQLYMHLDRTFLSTPPKMCNQALLQLIETQVSWIPRNLKESPSKDIILRECDYYVGQSLEKAADAEKGLAQLILNGVLRQDEVIQTLVTALVAKADRLQQGKKRLTCSSLPGVTEAALHEVGFALAAHSSSSGGLLRLFGLNPKGVGQIGFDEPGMPYLLCPSTEPGDGVGQVSQLATNAASALSLLGVRGSRNGCLIFDETVFFPKYCLAYLPSGPAFVGGAHERAVIPATTCPSTLKLTELAQETCFFMLKRADSRQQVYTIRVLPRRKKRVTWQAVLEDTATTWNACLQGNEGVPLMTQSHDNAAAQAPLNRLFLGLMPEGDLEGRDAQSDQEASWVLSANLLSLQSWDSPGMMLFMLLMSLTTGLWLGAAAFTPRELLHNALSGFYLVLLCISEAWARNDGGQWQSFFFHRTTCKNLLYVTAHLIERCRRWTADCPWNPSKTMEDSAEHAFSQIKQGAQGAVTLKQALLSTMRMHLRQRGQDPKPKDRDVTWTGLTDDEATDIANSALRAVCTLRAVVGVNMDPATIEQRLRTWFKDVGHALLFQGGPEELPEEDEGELGSEEETEEAMCEAASVDPAKSLAVTLDGLAMEAEAKEEIAALGKTVPEPAADPTPDTVEAAPALSPNKKPRPAAKTLASMLEHAGFASFSPHEKDSDRRAVERCHELAPEIVKLVTEIREKEGFLSLAQIRGGTQRNKNRHNDLMHALAKAQRAYGLVGGAGSWIKFSKMAAARAQEGEGDKPVAEPLSSFRPSVHRAPAGDDACNRSYQIVACRLHQLGEVKLAMIEQVWRGSIGRKSKAGSKPCEAEVPAAACRWVHLVELQKLTSVTYQATSLSPSWCMDPLSCDAAIFYGVPVETVDENEWRILLYLDKEKVKAALKLQGVAMASSEPADDGQTESAELFTIHSFPPTKAGRECMVRYMDKCRSMFERLVDAPMLDESGVPTFFKNLSVAKKPTWDELKARTPAYFETLLRAKKVGQAKAPSMTSDEYSASVWSKFSYVAPVKEKSKWVEFLRAIDSVSPGVLPE